MQPVEEPEPPDMPEETVEVADRSTVQEPMVDGSPNRRPTAAGSRKVREAGIGR